MNLKLSKHKLASLVPHLLAENSFDVVEVELEGFMRCMCCGELKQNPDTTNICRGCQEDFSGVMV